MLRTMIVIYKRLMSVVVLARYVVEQCRMVRSSVMNVEGN